MGDVQDGLQVSHLMFVNKEGTRILVLGCSASLWAPWREDWGMSWHHSNDVASTNMASKRHFEQLAN